ncbi:MAG TPA: UxaA family hydrolase [Dehalococcoidia bacterium]|nr:UxaA family hydrolase [Dehalococcoidia bacterium]
MKFLGYRRANGTVGTRNHMLVFPTVICAAATAEMISRAVAGTVVVTHPHGCGHMGVETEHVVRSMSGFCANPNVAGVLLVGLGCELITPRTIAERLDGYRQRYEIVNIQEEGGTTATVEKGRLLVEKLLKEAAKVNREPVDISELIVGTNCGGSDTFSGLTANPALGNACDRLVAEGGTAILSETPEMIGAEQVLAGRAASESVKKRIYEITSATEAMAFKAGVDIRGSEPSPGNIEGGLTTLEEKSLGAVLKGGTTTIKEVVDFAVKPAEKGLVIMDGPAHDAVCNTGMIAGGAQVIVFTTGRGTPMGAPIAPVIKVATNSRIYQHMRDNMDINAGNILEGTETIESIGERIFQEIVEVASGKATRAEMLGHHEFAIHSLGLSV